MVKMRLIEVRGMTEAGFCVSWAACEIDSRPTNEMIASDVPFIRLNGVGQLTVIVCTKISGRNANRKPKKRIAVSLTTSSPLTISLNAELSRTPIMFRVGGRATTLKTPEKGAIEWP